MKRFLIIAAAAAISAGTANASLIGDKITMSGTDSVNSFSQAGFAGRDPFSGVLSDFQNTRFTPVFTGDSIELGFSTEFGTNAWFFDEGSYISFSGIDWNGKRTIGKATLFETVVESELAPKDLTFTKTSVSLDLSSVTLKNGDIVRIDLTPVGEVPLPAGALLLLTAFGGLGAIRRRNLKKAEA